MKPRILYLCGQSPWQRNGGALLRNYWMIDALSRQYTVDLVVADEPAVGIPPSFAALIDSYASFPREQHQRSGIRRMMLAASPGESLLTAGWTNAAMRAHVADRLGRFPYVAIQTDLPMIRTLPRRDAIPLVYNAHNCESALLERRVPFESPHVAALLAVDALRVRRIERNLVARAALVTACADSDILDFERFAPSVRTSAVVIPNGVDVHRYRDVGKAQPDRATVLITGSMDWRPNIMGLRWFLDSVLPLLRRRVPQVAIRVAGRMQPALVAELAHHANVEAVPNPADMTAVLASATVVAAPILASSGTRLRILEAWAAQRPVVTTAAGAFGLKCEPGKQIAIHDSPAEFATGLAALLESQTLRARLVASAAEAVLEYDWRLIGAQLLTAYERLSDQPAAVQRVATVREEVAFSAHF